MYLKSLEIVGFKSFPDKTKLSFPQGITAVVGPNGSGKSNISDAVRWVLGEQSSKSLRGSKMEDVIFTGTDKRRAMGYSEVALTIDNRDRALPTDTDEVVVGRKLYRSGESEYRINQVGVRLRDVHELFMDTGLGRDGYCLVGQGKITEIISQKSTDRREIFEEAAGISKYRYRKEEAERRLSMTQENLLRLRDILSELEGRIGPLEEQAKKAEQFLTLSDERKTLEISLWSQNLDRLRDQLTAEQDKLLLAQGDYDAARGESEAIEAKMEEIYEGVRLAATRTEELRTKISALEEELAECLSSVAVWENDITHREETIRRLEGEIAQMGQSSREIEAQASEKRREAEESLAQAKEAGDEADGLETQLEQVVQGGKEADERLSALTERLGAESVQLSRARTLFETAGETAKELTGRIGQAEETRQRLAVEAERCEAEKKENDNLLAAMREEAQTKQNELTGYRMKYENHAKRRQKSEEEIQALELTIKERRGRAAMLRDLEESMEGFHQSVKAVSSAAKRGELRGILGPVSRLITVEERYALAVETALGASLQNIVTETEDAAKRAIAMLMQKKAGRATFLPLGTIKANRLRESGLSELAGFVAVADELVRSDERYRDVVSSLLGRTVVAEDLDDATAIAKRFGYRFRVVTLDGQVVNTGGSLTGGSRAQSAGLLSRKNEIAKLDAEAIRLEATAKQRREDARQIVEETAALEAAVLAIESELRVLSEDAIRLEGDGRRLSEALGERNERLVAVEAELSALSQRLSEEEAKRAKTGAMMAELERSGEEMLRQMEALSGERDKTAGRRDEIMNRISELRMRASLHERDGKALFAQAEELLSRRDQEERRGGELAAEMERVRAEIAATRERIAGHGAHTAAIRESILQYQAGVEAHQMERAEGEKQTTELRARERENATKRESISRELVRLEEKVLAVGAEHDAIVAKLWDDYEMTRTQADQIAKAKPIDNHREANRRLSEIRNAIKAMGSVHVGAIEEFKEVSLRYETLLLQVEDVEQAKTELGRLIGELTGTMREQFVETFAQIKEAFQAVFEELFGGGEAELSLGEGDPLECGIEIRVRPPGKIIKNLASLSGGEQSFVAIAIYLAILRVKPAPFCLLDEIEAALDDVNVARYAANLRGMTDKTQFILITHRRGTMEAADMLYGVAMQEEGVSKLLEMPLRELEAKLGLEKSDRPLEAAEMRR